MPFVIATQRLLGDTAGTISFGGQQTSAPPLLYGIQNFNLSYGSPSDQSSFGVTLSLISTQATSVILQAQYPEGTDLGSSYVDVAVLAFTDDDLPNTVLFGSSSGGQVVTPGTPMSMPGGALYAGGAILTGFNLSLSDEYEVVACGVSAGIAMMPSANVSLLPIAACTINGDGQPAGSVSTNLLAIATAMPASSANPLFIDQVVATGITNTIANPWTDVSSVVCFLQSFYVQFNEINVPCWCSQICAGIPPSANITADLGTSTVNIYNDGGNHSAQVAQATYLVVGIPTAG